MTGFTLIEVMVALAVLAIALGAVAGALAAQARTLGQLRERTLATYVAANAAALATLDLAPPETAFELPMGGRTWQVTRGGDADTPEFSVRAAPAGPVLARCRVPLPAPAPATP